MYVNQDGLQYNAPRVFDELIAKREMPVTIGVFVMHGRVKAPSGQALDRFNRSYEYDGLGDNYARFLLDELLPDVETKTAPDGRPIRLSKSGNDRAGIGKRQQRRDSMRLHRGLGAARRLHPRLQRHRHLRRPPRRQRVSHADPQVRAEAGPRLPPGREQRPEHLRRRLVDGQPRDGRLKFAWLRGPAREWDEDGHNGKHATVHFPDAMRFLWKGWPAPVKAGAGSSQLQQILIPGEGWQLVADGYKFTEGPAANGKGEVFFNDIPNSKTYKIGLDGKVTPFVEDSKRANGQAFGPDGRLYAVAIGSGQILAYDAEGKAAVVAEGIKGNDIVVRHDGGIFVTEPTPGGNDPSKVWFIGSGGEKKVVDSGLKYANGLTLSPDQSLLYVADYRSHWVYSYQVQPDGSLRFKQKYFRLHTPDNAADEEKPGARHPACASTATLRPSRVTTRMGLQVCDQAGRVNCIIPTPNGKVANLGFGGENFDILYATCGERVYKRQGEGPGQRQCLRGPDQASAVQTVFPSRPLAIEKGSLWPTEAPIKPAPPRL